MLPIYICEDNPSLLRRYQTIVNNILLMEEYDMKLQAAVTGPEELLQEARQYQSENNNKSGFYLLDIDLNTDIDGFELAKRIRSFDSRGFIVFITTHSEMAMLTFKHQVEAMDFILKEESWNIGPRIHGCMEAALSRYNTFSEVAMISFKSGSNTVYIEQDNILYITSAAMSHKVQIMMKNGWKEFYSSLNDCEQNLNEKFIRCHKAFIVNTKHVASVDRKALTITLSNGETIIASTRGINRVLNFIHPSAKARTRTRNLQKK